MIGKRLLGSAVALTMLTAACANNDGSEAGSIPADQEVAAAPAGAQTPAGNDTAAFLGSNELGNVLIGADGRTLYGFTNDIEAKSTCYGACEEAWPPVIVSESWTVGPGLDLGIFATTVRDDGRQQLVAGKWPLYFYVGDESPGDINGQGSGDVWFVAATDGTLLLGDTTPPPPGQSSASAAPPESAAPSESGQGAATVATGTTELGQTLTDVDGLTLYGFTQDTGGIPGCDGACAEAWPPLIVEGLPAGLDPSVFSVANRPDGTLQLVAGVWPLYRFAGDAVPGDINGQRSGDVWFAVSPDGGLIGRDGAPTGGSDAASTGTSTDGSGVGDGDSDY